MLGIGENKKTRQVIFRFNKIFTDHGEALRGEIGNITADHVARGLLRSGATVKRLYGALGNELSNAIGESLTLISNKTEHAGRYRHRLLDHLRDQVRHHADAYNELIGPKIGLVVGGSDDALSAAETLFRDCVAAGLDEVDKYDDGLTAPKDAKWHQRHPFWNAGVIAIVTGVVGIIVARIAGLL